MPAHRGRPPQPAQVPLPLAGAEPTHRYPVLNRADRASVSGTRSSAPSEVNQVSVVVASAAIVVLSNAVTPPIFRDNAPRTTQ